jgi:hypothetical protein
MKISSAYIRNKLKSESVAHYEWQFSVEERIHMR